MPHHPVGIAPQPPPPFVVSQRKPRPRRPAGFLAIHTKSAHGHPTRPFICGQRTRCSHGGPPNTPERQPACHHRAPKNERAPAPLRPAFLLVGRLHNSKAQFLTHTASNLPSFDSSRATLV